MHGGIVPERALHPAHPRRQRYLETLCCNLVARASCAALAAAPVPKSQQARAARPSRAAATRPAAPRIMRGKRFRLAAALFATLATALPTAAAAPFDLLVLRQ